MMEKIWLKSYPKGVPAAINADAYDSLNDIFEETLAKYPNRKALHNFGTELNYRQFDHASRDLAAYFQHELKLHKGDRIIIMLPNLMQYMVAMMAALRIGLVVVNTNPLYTAREVVHQLRDSGARAMLVLENFADVVAEALQQQAVEYLIMTKMGDMLGCVKGRLLNFAVRYIKKMIPVPKWQMPNVIWFKLALKVGKSMPLKPVHVHGQDLAFLQYTGGTTGVAKGAMLTHRNLIANLQQVLAWVKPHLTDKQEVLITALPLYHVFSLTANGLNSIQLGGLNVLITNPRDIDGFVKKLRTVPFSFITGVNTLFNALVHHPKFSKINFSSLKVTLGGGMAVREKVASLWKKLTHVPLLEAYGLTETSPAVCINPFDNRVFNGSIGLPLPSTEVSIRDIYGEECPPGKPGELCVKGPQVMQGYWQMPLETERSFTEDHWLKTGDVATMDKDGYCYIVDRKKDMIIVSGFNIYPNEIEETLTQHPDILDAAVVGVPHPVTGEQVKAFIVRKDPNLSEQMVKDYCRHELTAYKVPKLIEFSDELPKSTVGKVLRRELREDTKQTS